ncbi:MAG: shikimate kinase [Planctomycetota bacterium]
MSSTTNTHDARRSLRLAILGNSGSGKSTLARWFAARFRTAYLDLDVLAWKPTTPPERRSTDEVRGEIDAFCRENERWVVEGCYGDLVQVALAHGPRLVFLEPGVDVCLENCRARPFEPHKYATREEQDANLEMLQAWVRDYASRDGDLSLAGHRACFDGYSGSKVELRERAVMDATLEALLVDMGR